MTQDGKNVGTRQHSVSLMKIKMGSPKVTQPQRNSTEKQIMMMVLMVLMVIVD